MKQNLFYFMFATLLIQSHASAFTMRAVSPESIQRPAVNAAPATSPKDDELQTPDEIDFDDDFSVLV